MMGGGRTDKYQKPGWTDKEELLFQCELRAYRPLLDPGLTPGLTPHLLLLSLSGDVAPLDLPVAEEVAEVAEDGQDAVAHVGEDRHQHGRLLVGLDEGTPVQAAASELQDKNGNDSSTTVNNKNNNIINNQNAGATCN